MSDNPFQHIKDPEVEPSDKLGPRVKSSYGFVRTCFKTLELYVGHFATSFLSLLKGYQEEPSKDITNDDVNGLFSVNGQDINKEIDHDSLNGSVEDKDIK